MLKREKDSIDWLKWKYFGSPFGECICLLALKNEEIAGEVTFGKYEFILNGEIVTCLISYQTMVHPNHQKKGLFSKLTKQVLEIAKSEGIDMVFNFPNKASYVPFQRLNFVPLNNLKNYVYVSNKLKFISNPLLIKRPYFANKITELNKSESNKLETLKNSIHPLKLNNILTPNRTYEFLKWRYFTYPLYDYRIVSSETGWAIIRIGKRGIFNEVQVMEFFPEKELAISLEVSQISCFRFSLNSVSFSSLNDLKSLKQLSALNPPSASSQSNTVSI